MSTEVLDASPAPTTLEQPKCHAINVKEVPYAIWCRVRHNANLSQMTVREYVIRLLAEGRPYSGTLIDDKSEHRPMS